MSGTQTVKPEELLAPVNAHEALVAACEAGFGAMNMVMPGLEDHANRDAWFGAKDQLRAAIKLANGGVA